MAQDLPVMLGPDTRAPAYGQQSDDAVFSDQNAFPPERQDVGFGGRRTTFCCTVDPIDHLAVSDSPIRLRPCRWAPKPSPSR